MNNIESQITLSPQEISILEERKGWALAHLLVEVGGLCFAVLFYFFVLSDLLVQYLLSFVTVVVLFIPILRSFTKISDVNKDLRGGVKKVIKTQIEDYQEDVSRTESGKRIMSTYYLSLNGEKYEVKEEHYYPLNKGDFVNAFVAPHSKYAFHIEKIAQTH